MKKQGKLNPDLEKVCPFCDQELILPFGRSDAPIAIIGEKAEISGSPYRRNFQDRPGMLNGIEQEPFRGEYADVLWTAFEEVGIQDYTSNVQTLYLWGHAPTTAEGEFLWHRARAVRAASRAKIVLLAGDLVCRAIAGWPVSKVSGLWLEGVDGLTAKYVMAFPSPFSVYRGGMPGEIKLAIWKLVQEPEVRKIMGLPKQKEPADLLRHLLYR